MDAAGCVRSVPFPDLQQHRATSVTPTCLAGAVGWLPGAARPGQARSAALFQLATGLPAAVLPACWRRSRGILSAFRGPVRSHTLTDTPGDVLKQRRRAIT